MDERGILTKNMTSDTYESDVNLTPVDDKWYQNSKFDRYWNNVGVFQQWLTNHVLPNKSEDLFLLQTAQTTALSNMYTSLTQHAYWSYWLPKFVRERADVCQNKKKKRSQTYLKNRLKKIKGRNRKRRRVDSIRTTTTSSVTSSFLTDSDIESDDDDEIVCEMQLSDELLQFFDQTRKHREERDKQRELERVHNMDVDYVDASDISSSVHRATSEAPAVQAGSKRNKEMVELYGRHAPMIHGMETAMALTFDRNCDLKRPRLWPHLPINIKFE